MSEDTFPPPDEEELEAANALREALEGRRAGSRAPEEALQTAAFLRHAGDAGRLSSERRAQLRAELLAALPAQPERARKGWRAWLGARITLLGAAGAAVAVGVLGLREWSSEERASKALVRSPEPAAYEGEGSALLSERTAVTATGPAPSGAAPARPAAEPELQAAPGGAPSRDLAELDEAPQSAPAQRGLGAAEREAPAANAGDAMGARRAKVARGPAVAAAPRAAGAPSPREESLPPGAFASKAAPADEDDGLARGRGSVAGLESKGGGAAASAPATAAGAAPQPSSLEARSERQRLDQRSRLLAKLADTPVASAYRDADRARSASELERARERLSALSSAGLGGTSSAPEAEQLRPDVYCRLAELALRQSQPRAALDWTRQGLALGTQPSPFVACLYQRQGRAREALGDRDGAAQSYMNALMVNEQLLNESLDAP